MSNRPTGPHEATSERESRRRLPPAERPVANDIAATRRYTVTYSFDGRGTDAEPVSLIGETVTEMQREGTDIAFLGATQEVGPSGRLVEATARYSAPTKGTVGRLNCRARLPACGSPRRDTSVGVETDARRVAVVGGQ